MITIPNRTAGSVLILIAIALASFLALVALIVDPARKELMLKELKNATDASALSGATELNGTISGWYLAKSGAYQALKQSSFDSFNVRLGRGAFPKLDGGVLEEGIYSKGPPELSGSDFNVYGYAQSGIGTTASTENLEVVIERGAYWWDDNDQKYKFISLEGQEELKTQSQEVQDPEGGSEDNSNTSKEVHYIPGKFGLPVWFLANAVRTKVTIKKEPVFFAGLLGFGNYDSITSTSIAVLDQKLEESVAPFAIPACALMLNTNTWVPPSTKYDALGYNAEDACERELVFTEANFQVPQRWDGITRSNTYPRPPFKIGSREDRGLALQHSCHSNGENVTSKKCSPLNEKALPIEGVLGVPEKFFTSKNNEVTPQELGNFVKQYGKVGFPVRIGQRFKPLVDATKIVNSNSIPPVGEALNGFFDDQSVDAALADMINTGENFRDIFTKTEGGKQTLKLNYPALRTLRTDIPHGLDSFLELRYSWPTRIGFDPLPDTPGFYSGELLMCNMANQARPGDIPWTNPLCHSKSVQYPDDLVNAKARPVTIMIIAPGEADKSYCDWNGVFTGNEQSSYRPTPDTKPIVVGFLRAYMFDFNIMDLSKVTNPDGTLRHDGTSETVVFKTMINGADHVIRDCNPWKMRRNFIPTTLGEFIKNNPQFGTDHNDVPNQSCFEECLKAGCNPSECFARDRRPADTSPVLRVLFECFDWLAESKNPITWDTSQNRPKLRTPHFCINPFGEDSSGTSYPALFRQYYDDLQQEEFRQIIDVVDIAKTIMGVDHAPSADEILDFFAANSKSTLQEKLNAFLSCVKFTSLVDNLLSVYAPNKNWENEPGQREQTHCIPYHKNNTFNYFDPESWVDPDHLRLQFGCGGVRARLDCSNTDRVAIVGKPSRPFIAGEVRVPMLVE